MLSGKKKLTETNKRHVLGASPGPFLGGGTFRTVIKTVSVFTPWKNTHLLSRKA
jgi:hypothetical protein